MKRGFAWGSLLVLVVAPLLMATLGACQGSSPAAETPSTRTATLAPLTSTAGLPEPTFGEQPKEGRQVPTPHASEEVLPQPEESMAADLAIANLSGRLDVPVEEIATSSIEAVRWPDASLGCPQPGMMYAQVVTPGYIVILSADGATYVYHTDESKVSVLCELQTQPRSPVQGGDPAVQDGWPNQPRGKDVIVSPPTKKKP